MQYGRDIDQNMKNSTFQSLSESHCIAVGTCAYTCVYHKIIAVHTKRTVYHTRQCSTHG